MTKEKKYMIIGIFILMITLVGSVGTYAWFTWKSTSNTSLTMTIGKLADVIFTSGNNISTSTLAPVYNYTDGEVTTFSINNKDTTGTIVDYAVKLNITSIATELKSTSLKYVLLKNNTIVQEGDFSTISTGSTTIYSDSISTSGITNYKFYLYIDGNIENNTSMINKTLSGTLTVTEITDTYELTNGDGTTYTPTYNGSGTKIARSNAPLNKFKEVRVDNAVVDSSNYTLTEGSTIITFKESYLKTLSEGEHVLKIISTDGFTSGKIIIKEKETATQMITNLYNNAAKTTTTVNSVTYNLAPSVGLMNDRKGSMSTGINAGNIRYYGASPNNYIYFNCSDYNNQSSSTCETWRIIGVFDGKVKLIRNESIGTMEYDNDKEDTYLQSIASTEGNNNTAELLNYNINDEETIIKLAPEPTGGKGQNDYSKSSLQKILNNYYYNSLKYTGNSTYNFASTGIKNDTTRNMIADITYNLGGQNYTEVYPNQIYTNERGTAVPSGNATTWTGKIAIPYLSDYGYATDLSKCQKKLDSYNDTTCALNNWVKNVITNNGTILWVLAPACSSNVTWYVGSSGSIVTYGDPSGSHSITPVLYLNSKLTIKSGTGSSSTPYQLSLS